MADSTFDFTHAFIHQLLDGAGFENLSEEMRAQYVPQFAAEAERRLGIAMLPLLNEQQAKDFAAMVQNEATTPQQIEEFWKGAVPNFEAVVKQTLEDFANEIRDAVATLR